MEKFMSPETAQLTGMTYCRQCVQPTTRPGISLNDEGICTACVGHREKERVIDWAARKADFESLCDRFRGSAGSGYDCIVPVSGGKDSTYQVHVVKDLYGMHPLCVTYKTPLRAELGQRNLDNLVSRLGADLVELTVNPETERKFILKALREEGDCALPQHLGIFAFTLRTAVEMNVPLVLWGENSPLEYGGAQAERERSRLDRRWAAEHGCLKGKLAEDWVGGELTSREMVPFRFPTDEAFERAKIHSTFLGYYFPWDPIQNARVARELGFQIREEGPVLGIYDFADLDCELIGFHHYVKWLKFGMTRTFDNCSVEIRNGRMTREEAIERIRENLDDRPPQEHIDSMCDFLGISEAELFSMVEPFRNDEIWKIDDGGRPFIPGYIGGEDLFVKSG
jgi:N-acetyl sugar amidotransferase